MNQDVNTEKPYVKIPVWAILLFLNTNASKVEEAQKYMQGVYGYVDYDVAFELLQNVCWGDEYEPRMRQEEPDEAAITHAMEMTKRDNEKAMKLKRRTAFTRVSNRWSSFFSNLKLTRKKKEEHVERKKEDDVYALACYLMAKLYHEGKGTERDPNEAIRMPHLADQHGYKDAERVEKTARELMAQIISEEETIADTVESKVEIRDEYTQHGERYAIILHHADGSESEINLKGRNKLVYMLALMTALRSDATKLRARLFAAHHKAIVDLVKEMNIGTGMRDYTDWVNEFIYKEKPENQHFRNSKGHDGEGRFTYDSHDYSLTKAQINKRISEIARNGEEEKTFCVMSKGSREQSFMFIPIASDQIIIPDSLMGFVKQLPDDETVKSFIPSQAKWMPYREE